MMERFLNEYCCLELKNFLCFPSVWGRRGDALCFLGEGGVRCHFPRRHLLKDLGTLSSRGQVDISVGGAQAEFPGPHVCSLAAPCPWTVFALTCAHACLGLSLGVTLTPRSWPPDSTWKLHCSFCVGQTLPVLGPWGASCWEHGVSWPGVSAP